MEVTKNNSNDQANTIENIKKTVEKSTRKYINYLITIQNMNSMMKEIVTNLTQEVPFFQNFIESINYQISKDKQTAHIIIKFHTEITIKHRIKDLTISIK